MATKKIQMVLYVDFHLGQIVYLKTDPEQLARIITEIKVSSPRDIMYQLCCGVNYGNHHAVEITTEKNNLIGIA